MGVVHTQAVEVSWVRVLRVVWSCCVWRGGEPLSWLRASRGACSVLMIAEGVCLCGGRKPRLNSANRWPLRSQLSLPLPL
jgi:hypothetical protein